VTMSELFDDQKSASEPNAKSNTSFEIETFSTGKYNNKF